jgi:hypothetical protein
MQRFLQKLFGHKQAMFRDIPVEFSLYSEKAIQLIANSNGQLENKQILALFEANGIPSKEAVELLLFLPIAFCRHMLPQINWPNYYFEFLSESKSIRLLYEKNLRYLAIQSALQQFLASDFTQENYLKIAGRSASFRVINQLLIENPESELAEITVTPETIIY